MKVFVDTNVILEYVLQREQYAEAKLAIARGAELKAKLFMSVGSFIQCFSSWKSIFVKIFVRADLMLSLKRAMS